MAASKKKKVPKTVALPTSRSVYRKENPDSFYDKKPSWCFNSCDTEVWALAEERVGRAIWTEILPYLKSMETRTWADIFVVSQKQNHSIEEDELTARARKRLFELRVESGSVYSLRISGTHRLYGYIIDSTFYILWYDVEHGDNDTCVCRSRMKHT
ncbi:MAG: hypothetical protein IJN09_03710 [Oscillospiraceae bacterium]|nr:hypothetical protein [Oscillospiraceae bacterium]